MVNTNTKRTTRQVSVGARSWPAPQDFNEAIQVSTLTLNDADLKKCAAQCNALGLPVVASGNFASVYRLQSESSDWAVRCFLHPEEDRQRRYEEISKALASLNLSHTVKFEYLNEGIMVAGRLYPILKMEWIDGKDLLSYVKENLGNQRALRSLCQKFAVLVDELAKVGIAHGDLQHGNILVRNDDLYLVDYDALFVPDLMGLGSCEIGHRHYQHPARDSNTFDHSLDNFSAWSIYVSLFCLCRDPHLWNKVGAGDESLLFRQSDYLQPHKSSTLALLLKSRDPAIRQIAGKFQKIIQLEYHRIPALSISATEEWNKKLAETPPQEKASGKTFSRMDDVRLDEHESFSPSDIKMQFERERHRMWYRYVTKALLPNLLLCSITLSFSWVGMASMISGNPFGLLFLFLGLLAFRRYAIRLRLFTGIYARAGEAVANSTPILSQYAIHPSGETGLLDARNKIQIRKPASLAVLPKQKLFGRRKSDKVALELPLLNANFIQGETGNVPIVFDRKGFPVAAMIEGKLRLFI